MAATVQIRLLHGATPSTRTLTGSGSPDFRFKTYDDDGTADLNHPIPIPSASGTTNFSFWRTIALYATAGPTTWIRNMRYYQSTAGDAMSSGTSGYVGIASGYVQAAGTNDVTGNDAATGYTTITAAPSSWMSYNVSSMLTVQTGDCLTSGATGYFPDYLVFQMEVEDDATAGSSVQTTHYFVYDEA